MGGDDLFQPTVESGGRHPLVPNFVGGGHRLHQLVDPFAVQGRERHHWNASGLRKGALQAVADGAHGSLTVGAGVPLVDTDHQSPPFVHHAAGDGQILLLQPKLRFQQQHHHLGEIDHAQSVRRRELLELVGHLGATPEPRCVDQADGSPLVRPGDGDGVPGNAGFGPGQHALLAQELIDQRGLTHVGATDNGELQAVVGRVLFFLIFRCKQRSQPLVQLVEA